MRVPGRAWLHTVGEVLITVGLVVLLFCVYELQVTNLYADGQQHDLEQSLTRSWARPPATAHNGGRAAASIFRPGAGVARLYLPTLGRGQVRVVVEGVTHEDLKKGPGHYPGTALPGQIGNVVISGHRTTYGAPFNRVDELHVGDPIVLETADAYLTYSVTGETVVDPSDVAVILPVPGHPGQAPTQRLLTLTTCNPKYSATHRLIVSALLTERLPKAGGAVPRALRTVLATDG